MRQHSVRCSCPVDHMKRSGQADKESYVDIEELNVAVKVNAGGVHLETREQFPCESWHRIHIPVLFCETNPPLTLFSSWYFDAWSSSHQMPLCRYGSFCLYGAGLKA